MSKRITNRIYQRKSGTTAVLTTAEAQDLATDLMIAARRTANGKVNMILWREGYRPPHGTGRWPGKYITITASRKKSRSATHPRAR